MAGALLAPQLAKADDDGFNSFNGFNKNKVGDIFVILYENHNLTQPNPTNGTQQLLGNPAAPFINSLMTPGNPNATLLNLDGVTQILAPLGSPFVQVPTDFGGDTLLPHQTRIVNLVFQDPSAGAITYTARALNVTPAP